MILAIDATNIRAGGGLVHLTELLHHATPLDEGFSQVIVWCDERTAACLPSMRWLRIESPKAFRYGVLVIAMWRRFCFNRALLQCRVDALLVPGGSYTGQFRPYVVISQNMLPFENAERRRFGLSFVRLRLEILFRIQSRTFRGADGVIFLTNYAKRTIVRALGEKPRRSVVIPLGCSASFCESAPLVASPRKVRFEGGVRLWSIVYVSIIDRYKHQVRVVEAMDLLREAGILVELKLIGPAYAPELRRLRRAIKRINGRGADIQYLGAVPRADLPMFLAESDLVVFASSCENMPNILLEAMAATKPIACSNRGPMPEILGDGGVYFDPESPAEIAAACRRLIENLPLQAVCAKQVRSRAKQFDWFQCARETLNFVAGCSNHARTGCNSFCSHLDYESNQPGLGGNDVKADMKHLAYSCVE